MENSAISLSKKGTLPSTLLAIVILSNFIKKSSAKTVFMS